MSEDHPFGDVVPGEAVVARPPSDTLEGYQPRRQWVRGLGGKPIPRDWVRVRAPEGQQMTTAIERVSETPTVTAEQLALIKATVAVGATDAELKLFLFDCARQGVHPLDRLVFFTVRKQRDGSRQYTPITSIDFMRIRAADSGEMAGSDDPVFTENTARESPYPDAATVTVYRMTQGQRFAYTATARWSEYKPEQNDFMWRKMPHTMLGKCAEALALRKGFPRQLAGLYAKEEMDQAEAHAAPASVMAPINSVPPPKAAALLQAPLAGPAVASSSKGKTPAFDAGDGGSSPPEAAIDFELPAGFALIDEVKQDGPWLQVWWGRDAKGGWTKRSTKVPKIANEAVAAFEERVPVKLHSKDGKYLDRVERLDGGMSKEALAGTKWTPEQLENQSL